jgi:hypothetical protein
MGESAKFEITGARKTRESTDKHLVPSPFNLLPANLAHLPRSTGDEHLLFRAATVRERLEQAELQAPDSPVLGHACACCQYPTQQVGATVKASDNSLMNLPSLRNWPFSGVKPQFSR